MLGKSEQVQQILTQQLSIATNSDCLIDGSRKDRNSHYVLRLACLGSKLFQEFLTDAETQFFEYRLGCGGEPALRKTVLDLQRHISYALKHLKLSSSDRQLLLQIKEVSRNILMSDMLDFCGNDPCHHCLKVPWTLVESLVKDRLVIVSGGKAEINCSCLIHLLSSLFRKTLELGIKQLLLSEKEEPLIFRDARMVQVKKSLCRLFRKHRDSSHHFRGILKPLYHQDIEAQVPYFPPCMQELHRTLKKHNRLRHHSRFRYTVFLKDVGMPWWENVAFWEKFYSKPQGGNGSGCCHTWDGRNGSRYTYGIRHLYGMEGRKVSYASHSCLSLQELRPQPQEPGGCPFTSPNIEDEIHHFSPNLHGDSHLYHAIINEAKAGKPSDACRILLGSTKLSYRMGGIKDEINMHKGHGEKYGEQLYKDTETELCCMSSRKDVLNNERTSAEHNKSLAADRTLTSSLKHRLVKTHPDSAKTDIVDTDKPCVNLCATNYFSPIHSQGRPHVISSKTERVNGMDLGMTVQGCINSNDKVHIHKQTGACDLEDLGNMFSECQFSKPSQYYLRIVYG